MASEPVNQSEAAGTPTRCCDIVMKGGITSGVVYPLAVCELAREYRFRNIGGTSAGAIAAAAAAAAECGRRNGHGGFARLERLPQWVGADSHLFNLFQPVPAARPVFRVLTSLLRPWRRWHLFLAVTREFPGTCLAGALPAMLLAWVAWQATLPASVIAGVAAALLFALGIAAALGFGLYRSASKALVANGFGLCSGMHEGKGTDQALTPWLAGLLDDLAGRHDPARPLTFGDLWGHRDPARERDINLEVLTTNLTHGRPYRIPFEKQPFYFHPDEFRKLFPEEIVRWMVAHAREDGDAKRFAPLVPLPEPADLPVVVAARMSLSFPVLISAVPLWAVDYTRKVPREERVPERCWFSDGGICSNFPVHFFDSLIPRWPTFGINLSDFHPDYPQVEDESSNVWMPRSNGDGQSEAWNRFDSRLGTDERARLTGFGKAIFRCMQNWMDNSHLRMPGYRDRIVHVCLDDKNEGGLKLRMSRPVLVRLSERGRHAGKLLLRRYVGPPEPGIDISWDNHRWVRYRSTMDIFAKALRKMRDGYRFHHPADRTYGELILRKESEAPGGYRWKPPDRATPAFESTEAALGLVEQWEQLGIDFDQEAPRPAPELRVAPRI